MQSRWLPCKKLLEPYRSVLKPLLIGLVAVLLTLAFVKLAGEVIEGDTRSLDTHLLHSAQAPRAGHPREKQRRELLGSRLLAVYGTWQREGEARNLIAGRLEDLTPRPGRLATASRDFH